MSKKFVPASAQTFSKNTDVGSDAHSTADSLQHTGSDSLESPSKGEPLNYRAAGVDIDAGDSLVERIASIAAKTKRPEIHGGIGGFAALCAIPKSYREPILVTGTDGVGTKLALAQELGKHDTVGIDLVAMCVNDILCCGAEPLLFLDYFACAKLDVDAAERVIQGIAEGCLQAGCALGGGETAELPGMMQGTSYELAGFALGVVEKDCIIDGSGVAEGNELIALASNGLHANGFSLARLALSKAGQAADPKWLEPTRIYCRSVRALIERVPVKAVAHITGGGISGNVQRVIPKGLAAQIDRQSWAWPKVFTDLQTMGAISDEEMRRVFNCGVGMVVCVPKEHTVEAIKTLEEYGEHPWLIGDVRRS